MHDYPLSAETLGTLISSCSNRHRIKWGFNCNFTCLVFETRCTLKINKKKQHGITLLKEKVFSRKNHAILSFEKSNITIGIAMNTMKRILYASVLRTFSKHVESFHELQVK